MILENISFKFSFHILHVGILEIRKSNGAGKKKNSKLESSTELKLLEVLSRKMNV